MPVVLVTAHGEPRAGYTYDDRTGISYEYPDGRYEAWITTGDRFVYHTLDFGYTGAGVIGKIRSSPTAGRLVCDILDYEPWDPQCRSRMPTASTSRPTRMCGPTGASIGLRASVEFSRTGTT